MRFYFTKHAKEKFAKVKKAGFPLKNEQVENTIENPNCIENRKDGTFIASKILDSTYVLRVVYRKENDIMIVITFYPARRKDYEI
jgi:hypothetical protein